MLKLKIINTKKEKKNDNLKEIYEKLNEIQYLLKFTYSKKKIRRKVKEVMLLVEKVGDDNDK